jgi:hypothetical protein
MSLHHELMDIKVLRDARPGAAVVTCDGKKLGEVAETDGHYIKVDVRFGRDYWLKADYVVDEAGGRVTFGFEKKDLGAYRVDKPAIAADPLVDQQDAIISGEEQVEQRRRMERELEEQRGRAG